MGWVKETHEMMKFDKKIRYFIYVVAVIILIGLVALVFFIFRNGIEGHSVKAGPIELPEIKPQTVDNPRQIIDTNRKNQGDSAPSRKKSKDAKNTLGKHSFVTQENKNGDNNLNNGINNGIIGGTGNTSNSNNHIVNGINNGVNGDVITEKQLSEAEKIAIINHINEFKIQYSTNTNVIFFPSVDWSNAPKFASQLRSFLKEKGFEVKGEGVTAITNGHFEGLSFSVYDNNSIQIIVGIL